MRECLTLVYTITYNIGITNEKISKESGAYTRMGLEGEEETIKNYSLNY